MMTKVRFVNGYTNTAEYKRWSPFLIILRVPYILLVVDDEAPHLVYNMADWRSVQSRLGEFVTTDELTEISAGVTNAELYADVPEVLNNLRKNEFHRSFSPPFDFKICTDPNCGFSDFAHGKIERVKPNKCKKDGWTATPPVICTLREGFEACEKGVRAGLYSPHNAIKIFQQMVEAGLFIDLDELLHRQAPTRENTSLEIKEPEKTEEPATSPPPPTDTTEQK